jgi:hypothetical protein
MLVTRFCNEYKEKSNSVLALGEAMKLLELLEMEDTLKDFVDNYNTLYYLADLSENQIWESYEEAI